MSPVCHLLKNSRSYVYLILVAVLCAIMMLPMQRTAADSQRANNTTLSPDTVTIDDEKSIAEAQEMFSKSAIRFEVNHGQTDKRVKYIARGGSSRFFLTPEEVVFVLYQSNQRKSDRKRLSNHRSKTRVIRMHFSGAKKDPEIIGEQETEAHSNYFIGNDRSKWLTDVPTFAQVRYREIYPGIDVVYHGNQKQLQYDFEIAPGANPDAVAINFSSVKKIKVADDGSLQLLTATGEFRQQAPFAYQDIDGRRVAVDCKYVVRRGEVRFQLGYYDHTRRLVIDPTVVFSTYIGGNGEDRALDIAIDGSRSVYVTGQTVSTDFPVGAFPIETWNGGTCLSGTYPCFDAFVTKLTPGGGSILYSTYFGGTKDDIAKGITVDWLRRAYIVGETGSVDFPIPINQGGDRGVYKAVKKGPTDGFMVQLSTLGNELRYGTFINGFGSGTLSASAESVAVDILGHVWIGGSTVSIDFPTGSLFGGFVIRSSYCKFGGDNGFLIKINPDPACTDQRNPPCPVAANTPTDPTDFIYGSYVCGSGGSEILDIALDSVGNLWMAGKAGSSFPTTLDAFQPGISDPSDVNERDGFVAKTDMFGIFLLYASYMGGTSTDSAESIACDSNGNAYVAGATSSSNFPITPGVADSNYGGLGEAFVMKFLSSGLPAYSTFVGGANNLDSGAGVAVDDAGNAYVTGNTGSTNFPITPDATQSTNGGGGQGDSFLAKLSPDGSVFQFSTYLGGSGSDFGNAVAVDKAGNAYIAGRTSSTNFPAVNAFDSTFGGGQLAWDGFVTKISTEMFVISGRVTDSNNIGFNGVTVTLSGSRSGTTTTDVSGNYSFEVPPNGSYTVTPSRATYTFSPSNLAYSNLNEDKGAYFSTASAQPSPTVFPVPNVGDALVQDNGAASSTNYGSAPELLAQVKVTTGMNRETYLKFDVSNFQSATTVKLKMFGRLNSSQNTNLPASLFSVADTSWDEKTITWNGKPTSGGTALDTETILDTTARWYEWDVTSYVNAQRTAGNSLVSFVLKNDNSSVSVTRFNSREAGENFPRLEVTAPTVGSLTSPWSQSGVPTTLTAGSTELTSDIFTITGAGAGVTDAATADAFHYVYQQVTGDFKIVARVLSMDNLGSNSRAGIQIRASLQADAVHTSLMDRPGQGAAELTARLTSGGGNTSQTYSGFVEWLMLMRQGNEVRAYVSADGVNWISVDDVTHTNLPSQVYVGMFVSSGHASNQARARFSNVGITTGTQNPPPSVVITVPRGGATFNANSTIPLSALALDANGSISNLEFRTETTVLASPSPTPANTYNFAWTNVQSGIYTISARATDNGGAVTTSPSITISVNPPGATTLNPTADANVTDGQTTTNFGSDEFLQAVEDVSGGDTYQSYLKFNISGVSNITRATLRLYPTLTTGTPIISVSEVSDTSWTEGGITWSNKPSMGDLLRLSFISATYYTWDITDYVVAEKAAGHQVISVVLHGNLGSTGSALFSSRETTNGGVPELLITDDTYHGRASAQPDANMLYPLIATYLRRYEAPPLWEYQSEVTTENSILASQSPRAVSAPADDAYVPDELLIQYEDGASENTKAQARERVKGTTKEKLKSATRRALERGPDAGDLELVKLPHGQNVQDAVRLLRNQRGVRFAEPNLIYHGLTTPDDTFYVSGDLWNMYGPATSFPNDYASNAGGAWDAGHTGATTVYVGVLDTGVEFQHSDLRRNAWTNSLDPPDGVDNDRNGYVDDTFGWDFVNGDNTVFDGAAPPSDIDVHGTHVTGSIAAVGGNNNGVVGVSWRTTFIPVKILNSGNLLTLSNAIKALDYLTDLKLRHGINIVATNNSWGGNPNTSKALLDAIARSARANILFVTGAGNGGSDGISDDNDLISNYPANYDTTDLAGYDAVISVTSVGDDGVLWTSANYGVTTVDLAAPGVNIRSTVPLGGYAVESGTSMAAPHVTGALALYASMYRTASPAAVKGAILESARQNTTPSPSLEGRTVTGGRLNVGFLAR